MTDATNPRERRLVLRLLDYWRDLAGDRDMPAPKDVDGADIADMWEYCFVITVDDDEPTFTCVGDWHREFDGVDVSCAPVGTVEVDTLIGRATSYLDEVLTRRIPASYGGDFVDLHGRCVLYRSILLPLSSDGSKVEAVLGGANCRITVED